MARYHAKVSQNDAGDRFTMRLHLEDGQTITLWADKSFDEALGLVDDFQRINDIPDEQVGNTIDVVELM